MISGSDIGGKEHKADCEWFKEYPYPRESRCDCGALVDPDIKKRIDEMSQMQLCAHWRFARIGDPLLQEHAGAYFSRRMKELGGMTPEISKAIGWDR